ncbi:MAG: hypothetical protein CK424_01685 [Legionella sp.]|nr:MAG: hypothetical protein CK424_01685 [Legionella sp.]
MNNPTSKKIQQFWTYLTESQHLRIVRYLMVGLTNMTVCVFFMYIGSLAGLHYLEYTILGYLISILYSFYMNLRFTFQVTGNIKKRLILFFVINLSNLGLVGIIEYVMIDIFKYNHQLSIICAMLWYSIAGFTMNTFWVYRRSMD